MGILSLDAVATVLVLPLAFWLRFDGMVPARHKEMLLVSLPLIVASRLLSNLAVGLHRWSFHLAGLPDALSGHDVDRIEVACDGPLPLQADGEDLGDVEKVVFECERDAVSVLV